MNNQIKRVVLVSLAADFIASLLFIFSLQLKIMPIIMCFYLIDILLVISSLLACVNNYKKCKLNILLFMSLINIVLMFLYTFVLFYI